MVENYFGAEVAARYDAEEGEMFAPAVLGPAVDFLAELAGDGPALEFGVGTGRIALPLSERVAVHGIDLSEAMIGELRAKPGADRVHTTAGDFATTTVPGEFTLAYLVFNTIGNLTTQDGQVDCFRNAAAHLAPGGHFVIEVGVPQLRRVPPGETLQPFAAEPGYFGIDEYDAATQRLVSHHLRKTGAHYECRSIPFRYVWPGELDLMARIAGMSLVHRYADWARAEFTHESTKHISVWRKQ